jgi:hypothetical protein
MVGIAPAEATNGNVIPLPAPNDVRGELEQIRNAARAVPTLSSAERERVVDRILALLHERFLPRGDTEEATIYPTNARALSEEVTASLVFDHLLIEAQAAELAAADPRDGAKLQELLYGIRVLMDSHLEREQHLYARLPFGSGEARRALARSER